MFHHSTEPFHTAAVRKYSARQTRNTEEHFSNSPKNSLSFIIKPNVREKFVLVQGAHHMSEKYGYICVQELFA
jgi:hypothetical protein